MALRLVKVNMGAQQAAAMDAEVKSKLAEMSAHIESLKDSYEQLAAKLEAAKEAATPQAAPMMPLDSPPPSRDDGLWAKLKRMVGEA